MTSDDIARIEQSLGIDLPASYRELMTPFPLPAYAGNADSALWDDADRIITYNRELRGGGHGVKPWPSHFFALGRDHGGCTQALDLSTGKLWWADHSQLDAVGSYAHTEPFEEWAAEYVEGLRSDLEGEEGDPAGTPLERELLEARNAGGWGWVVALLVVALVYAAWKFG